MPDKRNLPAKRQPQHGIYSWVNSKKVPGGRAFQAIRRELGVMREELVRAHGGERISPDAAILVDSTIEALGVQKLLGLYVRKYGVVDAQGARRGRLELSPILAKNWISYGNTVRQAILALRELDKAGPPADPVLTIEAIKAEYEAKDAEARAATGQGQAGQGAEQDGPGESGDEIARSSANGEAKETDNG